MPIDDWDKIQALPFNQQIEAIMDSVTEEFRMEGEAQGMILGKAEVLVHLLTLRFGSQDDAVMAKIEKANSKQLTVWSERTLFVKTIDGVFL